MESQCTDPDKLATFVPEFSFFFGQNFAADKEDAFAISSPLLIQDASDLAELENPKDYVAPLQEKMDGILDQASSVKVYEVANIVYIFRGVRALNDGKSPSHVFSSIPMNFQDA